MRRFTLFTSMLILALVISSCSIPSRSGTDHDENDEETEAEETLPEGYEPLSEDILEGTWVTEHGRLCSFDFDEDIFTDSYGVDYDIVEVKDDSIELCLRLAGRVYEFTTLAVPNGDTFTIDATYANGELYILDSVAHNIDSDFGEEFTDNLRGLLSGNTFYLQTAGTSITFNDDLTTMSAAVMYGTEDVDIEFTGYSLYSPSEDYEMNLWVFGDDVVILGGGQIGYCTDSSLDLSVRFLYYDAATDYIEIIDYPSADKTSLPVLNTSPYSSTISTEYGTFVQYVRQPGVFISEESMSQYSADTVDNTSYLIDMRSPYAEELLERAEVIELDEGEISARRIDFTDGYAEVDLYDNQWPGEYVSIYSITSTDEEVGSNDWSVSSYSRFCGVLLTGTEYVDSHPLTRIYFEYDGEPYDGFGIYMMSNSSYTVPQAVDTHFEDGYAWAEVPSTAVYFLGTVDAASELTQENFFDVNPEDTIYGRLPEYEDILSLVDMDYIEQSYYGVFVVDSAEDLASLTYFINAYPRTYEDNFFVWVDMVDDIDISDYNWVSLGHDDGLGFRSFSGIFCGNGHTITGLRIDNDDDRNGFFGDIYFSTVIGVNLQNALVSGVSSGLFACEVSTTDFYDCHAQGIMPDNYDSGSNLFHAFEDYGNNGYLDCSIEVVNASGSGSFEEFSINLPRADSRNELYELFCPNANGNYSYTTDYFFGDNVPT